MGGVLESFIGANYELLTVLDDDFRKDNGYTFVHCQCKCGNDTWVNLRDLQNGHTKSCGCLCKTVMGLSKTRIYHIWQGMKYRCSNSNCDAYKYYGARNIKVDDAWSDNFLNFYNDMGESYYKHVAEYGEKNTTLDRIDPYGNYCKDNCRWATYKEQNNHLRPKIDREDILGERFGRLVVQALDTTKTKAHYLCKCDCGNEVIVIRGSLLSGGTKSCGCLHRDRCSSDDSWFINKKFNKLTVMGFAYVKKHRKYYRCICDCGNLTVARGSDLKNGHKKTCGKCKKVSI